MIFYGLAALGLYDAMLRKRRAQAAKLLAPPTAKPMPFSGTSPKLSIFSHSTLSGFVGGLGFLGAPVLVVLICLPLFQSRSALACVAVPIVFGSAIVGATVATAWFRGIAARCPSCGGRAFSNDREMYRCRDCGEEHGIR